MKEIQKKYEIVEELDATVGQEALWIAHQMEIEKGMNNEPIIIKLKGNLQIEVLKKTLTTIVQAHPALRTIFKKRDEKIKQLIQRNVEFDIPIKDLTAFKNTEQKSIFKNFLESIVNEKFSLEEGPLFKFHIIKFSEDTFILHLMFHHIIYDGWSLGVFIRQLSNTYGELLQGKTNVEFESPYKNLVEYEEGFIDSAIYKDGSSYWKDYLQGELTPTEFPIDFNKMNEKRYTDKNISKNINSDLFYQIQCFAKKNNISIYRVMLSTYCTLLHQMTNAEEIIVGIPINTRPHTEERNTFGYFVNTLPIRITIEKGDTFKEILNKVNKSIHLAITYKHNPYSHIVKDLNLNKNTNDNMVYSTAFNTMKIPELKIPDIESTVLTDCKRVNPFNMTWRIMRYEGETENKIEVDYNSALYKPESISDLVERYIYLLQKLMKNVNEPIHSLDLLLAKDHRLYKEMNSNALTYPNSKTLDQLIDLQALESPNQIAISMGDKSITYYELQQRSNQIANYLRENDIKKGQSVSIIMVREIDTIVWILGILKSGGVYVPIDPKFPEKRIEYILKDSESQMIITKKEFRGLVERFAIHTIYLEDFHYANSIENIASTHTIEDAAYIIYTSGSTGLPKGVVVPHKGVVNLSYSVINTFHLGKEDVFLQFATIIFDASIMEIFPILLCGGRMHLISDIEKRSAEEFINVSQKNGITNVVLPTAFFKLIADMPKEMLLKLNSVKRLFVGGETLPAESVRKWQSKLGLKIPVLNAYGPTETTVCATMYEVNGEIQKEISSIPIGKPIANSEVYVVSPFNTLCPSGVVGELFIGGDGVANGYLNQKEKTEEAFISFDKSYNHDKKMYRTGDLVRLLPNGNLEFIGRKDNQVKIRGYRIELDEIEGTLFKHPEVRDAVVFTYQNDKIVSFYLSKDNTELKQEALKTFLSESLPDFMMPNYVFHLESFPVSPSGKLDRKKLELQIPSLLENMQKQYVPPISETEKRLAKTWAEILNLGKYRISREDDFFKLGGHSLIAVQVLNQIQKEFHLKIEIRDIFEHTTIASLSAYIDKLMAVNHDREEQEMQVLKVADKESYQLSSAQKRIWFLNKYNAINRVYDTPLHIYIEPSLNKDILQDTIRFLVERHEMLRTVFIERNGEPRQVILNSIAIDLIHDEIEHMSKKEQQEYIRTTINQTDHTPFDLEKGPLFRIRIFNLNKKKSYLYINLHHIITDEWSVRNLLDELMRVYSAFAKRRNPELPTISNRYVDYAEWEQAQLNLGRWDTEKSYWMAELAAPLPILNLPLDFSRNRESTNKGTVFEMKLDNEMKESLKKVCEQENVSMYMLFLAAYIQLLHYLTDQKDIIVGTPVVGRNHQEFEQIQGFFVNTLAIRTQLKDVKNLTQLLQVVREKCLNSFQNQSYPFDKVIEQINPDRSFGNNPIFSTMFSYQKDILQQHDAYKLQLLPNKQDISKFDIALAVEEGLDYVGVSFEYDINLFKEESINRFTQNLLNILDAFIHRRTVAYENLSFLSQEEESLYKNVNHTERPYPYFQNIQEQFYMQVDRQPDRIAIATETESLTYRQLNMSSNQVAQHLLENGIKRGDKVAIFLDRSMNSIVSMLGILKAGAAYIPIDVKYPEDRINYIVRDSEACRIITSNKYKSHLNVSNYKISIIEDIYRATINDDVKILNKPDDLAYVIYTSGSTGKPKGTLLTHKGVLNLVEWRNEVFQISSNDKVTQFYSHSFDSSVSEIFSTLLNGAELYVLSDEQRYSTVAYAQAIQETQATISDLPTVFFNELSTSLTKLDCEKIRSLRFIIMGGEAASTNAIRSWQSTFKNQVQLVNEYGPTEATVSAMYYFIPVLEGDNNLLGSIPIGIPISNTKVHILNSYMQHCPVGAMGELYIESLGLAQGYWKQEEKTKQAFISNPFSEDNSKRLYRTGDLARWLPNGNIEFMGRKDKQVKIRGHRIELGEIEDAMLQLEGISQAVVTQTEDGMLLQAYYKTVDGIGIEKNKLALHLSNVLPEYMVPKYYSHVLEIPITANGKIDFEKLPKIEFGHEQKDECKLKPQTKVQKNIAKVWSEVLNVKSIGLKDDFFNLGGHSLKVMPALVKLKPLYPNLKIQDFFKYRTIEKLASHIEEKEDISFKKEKNMNVACMENETKTTPVYERTKLEECELDMVNYPKTVFLTGATGYLGAHILERLLQLPSATIYCLVRKNEDQVIGAKLKERMEFYFGKEILQKLKEKVELIEGDLSLMNLGLDLKQFDHLKNRVESIIHCGGEVRHYGEREHFQKVNVQSTKYLLELAKNTNARFHYISTLSVVGQAESDPKEFEFFESNFDRGQNLDNLYLESKFQGEKMVREAMEKGVRATIYRVGNLVGNSKTGKFQYNINENAFYRLLKGICLSSIAPDVNTYVDLTPVDYGSLAITELSYKANTVNKTMHICNPIQLKWEQFINSLQAFGYDILLMKQEEYIEKFFNTNLTTDEQKALELIMPLLESVEELSVAIPSCLYTQGYLKNIHCVEPNQEYINLLLNYAMSIEYLPLIKEPILL
ncbi:non-ribosomal peptide synthetase [Bacillus cereus]|uniref:non-ribosomal peptide synthetase n=1 Tax=Bacillus cereus TaxID=1396 RepID=UPI000BF72FEC|nr:non-ribosomal peptide synthetase [Bacillus cereus]PEY62862.1 non-ribosomal peptide synthetase [Bacillus cereus]PFT67261.1 non-ribosomal peptide synthetase [Bacillus cereus]PGU53256.1 non-ribosomal peptide synthetase [Bacillus cereus]